MTVVGEGDGRARGCYTSVAHVSEDQLFAASMGLNCHELFARLSVY